MHIASRVQHAVVGLAILACLGWSGVAEAQTPRTWNVTSGVWQTGANWAGGSAPSNNTTTNSAVFVGAANESSSLNAAASIAGLTFSGAGTKTISSDSTTARVLTLGGSGITVNATSGAVTLGNATNTLNLEISADQTWTNNSANLFTVLGTVRPNVATAGTYTLTVTGSGNTTLSGALNDNGSRILALTKTGLGTLTLGGANTLTGASTISAGGLVLDYSSQDNSKLANGAALTLGSATTSASVTLSGGSHLETVGSTTLGGGYTTIARSGGSSTLQLNAITRSNRATIDFGAASLADTDTLNDATGILGPWATVGGTDWATNSTNAADGAITAYAGYTDIDATGSTLADGSSTNVRLNAAGPGGNVQLGATTTAVNTLLQNATNAATVNTAGGTLRTSGIMVGSAGQSLTLGRAPGSGTLTAATAGGELMLINNSANPLRINALVADNTSASSLTKSGTGRALLAGGATYTGATAINAGTLDMRVLSGTTTLSGAISGPGGLVKSGGGALTLSGANSNFSGPLTLAAGTVNWSAAGNLGTGQINVTGNAVLNYTPTSVAAMSNSLVSLSDGSAFRFKTSQWNTPQNLPAVTGGSALNPVRFYYDANSHIDLKVTNFRGNVTATFANRNSHGTIDLGHPGNIYVDYAKGAGTFNSDVVYAAVSGGGSSGTWNRRLFVLGGSAFFSRGGAVTLNNSSLNYVEAGTLISNPVTFNFLPVGFWANNVAFGGGLQGTVGVTVDTATYGYSSMSIDVTSAAGDVFTAGTLSNSANQPVAVNGPGRLTLQRDSGIGAGRLTLSSSASFTTTANLTTTGTITLNAGSTLRLAGAAGRLSGGSHAGAIVNSGSLVYQSGSNQTLSGVISGAGSLGIAGDGVFSTGTLTLSGANTFSGATTLSAGSLVLNYATQDNSKLSTSAALTLGNAAISLAGGSHAQTVLSTALTTGASSISRPSGAATLNLNAITRAAGSTLDLGAASIATTDTTNTNGILGGWATLAGADWAFNSTNGADGAITALASYASDTWSAGTNTTITGNGGVTDGQTGSLRFAAAAPATVALTGTAAIGSGGILVTANVGASAAGLAGGAVRGSDAGELFVHQYNTGAAFTIGSQIVDGPAATRLVKAGGGTLALTGSSGYTGGTVLSAGTIEFANGGLGSSGTVQFAGNSTLRWASGNTQDVSGRLALGSGVTATLDTNGNNVTLGSGFGGAGGLVKAGAGSLTLSGSNSFSGNTTISTGTLALGHAFGLGASTLDTNGAGRLSFGSVTAATLGGLTGSNSLVLENASGGAVALTVGTNNAPTLTYSGVLSGAGSFEKTGYGRLILTGANQYSGPTTISNGYVTLSGGANRLPAGTNLSFANQAGAILDLNGQTQVIGSLTGGGTTGGHVWMNNGSLFVGNSTSGTYGGSVISGTAGFSGYFDNSLLVKQGTGTLTLSGASTFGGTLRVDTGTLRMQGDNLLGLLFNAQIADAGTLDLNGFSAIVASLRGSGTVSMKDGTGALTVRSQSNLRNTFAGRLTGFGALIKEAGQTTTAGWLTLTNANNDYSGGTQLAGGVLEFASGALGSTGQITVTTDPYLGGASVLRWQAGNTQDISSRLVIVPGVTATLDTNGNDVTFATGIGNNGFGGLTKMGLGSLSLAAANTFTGLTSVNAGTLRLDFAAAGAPASDILASESSLAFGGGTLLVRGNASGSVSQSLGNVTLNAGGGSLLVNPNGGTSTTVNLGTITGTAAGSALLVGTQSGAAAGTATVTTLTGTDVQGIYGGRVVFTDGSANGFNWATATAASGVSTLAGLASGGYATLTTTAGTDTANSLLAASATLGGSRTTNTLKIEQPAAGQSLSIGAGNTLTLTAGGILATGAEAFTISAGTLTAGNGSGSFDLVVHQYNAGGLTISSVIGNNSTNATSLTKAGSGNLTLSGANTFTGGVFLTSGTLTINNAAALGTSASRLTIQPGTTIDNTSGAAASSLTLSNNPQTWNGDFTYAGTGGRSLNMGTGAVTLGNDANLAVNGGTLTVGAIGGSGFGLTKSGAGTLAFAGANTFTGPLTVGSGTVTSTGARMPNTDIVLADVAGAAIVLDTNAATIQSLSGGGSTGGNFAIAANQNLTIAGNASTTYGGRLTGGGGSNFLTKNGVGTLTLTNTSNSFTSTIRVNEGTLAFSGTGALGAATSAIELNQAGGGNSGGIAYTGNANTALTRGITVTNGLGSVSNLGSGTLTLSGTLTKNGTILRFNQGAFSVSGRITGANANSDLYVDGANVTLSNTNNDYNGPTFVYGGGTLALGASGVIPNGSPVTLGDSTTRGTLDLGTFTEAINQLAFSGSGGTVRMAANQTASPQLNSTSSLTLGSNASLDLSGMQTTAGNYRLISASSLSGTFGSVTGLDSNYLLRYGTVNANEISAQRKANQTFTMTTGTVTRALVNTNVAVSGTLTNSTLSGGSDLTVSLSSGGGLTVGSLASGTTSVAPLASTPITGTIQAGSIAGPQTWSVINTDNNAITTTSTAAGSLQVVNERTFSVSNSGTINLGNFLRATAVTGSTTISSIGLNDTTANASLGAFSGGPSGFSLTTLASTDFLGLSGTQSALYTLSGSSASAGAITGSFTSSVTGEFGAGAPVSVALVGTAYDPAIASFNALSTLTSGTVDIGSFNQNTGVHTQGFSIFNLFTGDQTYAADLMLESISLIGPDAGSLSLNLSGTAFGSLTPGLSSNWLASLSSLTTGTFSNQYQLNFASAKDGQSLGGSQSMTLTVTGVIIVPEPGALALAGIGIAAAAYAYRRRRS